MEKTTQTIHRSLLVAFVVVLAGACATNTSLPPARGLITLSGARLPADDERMDQIDLWVRAELQNIEEDPTFLISTVFQEEPVLPWEGLVLEGDTARIRVQGGAAEARSAFLIYAHLHLMDQQGRLAEWLPDAEGLEGFELEKAIVSRTADAWYYGRSVFAWAPYSVMDEVLYSRENGYLDAYLLTARAEEFPTEREAWLDGSDGALEEYRNWFREAFETNPPGLR